MLIPLLGQVREKTCPFPEIWVVELPEIPGACTSHPERKYLPAWIPRIREMVGTHALLLKGNMGACCWGLRKLTEAFLHQKLIEQTQERTFHARHDSFFTLSPITVPIYPFPPSPFPSPVTPITHAHTRMLTHFCSYRVFTCPRLLVTALHSNIFGKQG